MTGSDRNYELEFAQPVDEDAQKGRVFRIAAETTTSVLRWGEYQIGIRTELIFRFLLHSQHRYGGLFDRVTALSTSAQLNRITEYIRANWSQQLDTEIVAEVGGISGPWRVSNVLQIHACSPQAFVKQIRLEKAHSCLSG
jgi:hypothetical protein